MPKNSEFTLFKRSKVGERLDEVMRIKGYKQAELIREADPYGELPFSRTHLSDVINGRRPLPEYVVYAFSNILSIMPGYLLGDDQFKCESYADYEAAVKDAFKYIESNRQYKKYEYLLDPLGYTIVSFSELKDGCGEYGVSYDNAFAQIPRLEMENLEADVKAYISMRMDKLMEKYGPIQIDGSTALVFYRSMGRSVHAKTGCTPNKEYIIIINSKLSNEQKDKVLKQEIERIKTGSVQIDPKVKVPKLYADVKKVRSWQV